MFKTILATAAAALIATTLAAPAQAGRPVTNGVEMNGLSLQGVEMNGRSPNGKLLNATIRNGRFTNGAEQGAQGFAIDAIELPASVR